jgi:hypothetical protein
MQCDYLLGFQTKRRINESILLQKWPRNVSNTKDNAYETIVLAYSRELDLLVLASSITKSYVEEDNSPPYLRDVIINLKEETMNSKDTTSVVTPQSAMSSNKLNDPLMACSLGQYVWSKV